MTPARKYAYKPYGKLHENIAHIEDAILANGPYSHNIVSLSLRSIQAQYGTKKANAVVKLYRLSKLFGIRCERVGKDDVERKKKRPR